MQTPKSVTALNAVTASATSVPINVTNARKITVIFTRANNAGGTSTFSVLGSANGADGDFVTLNSIVEDVANTNVQNYSRASSIAIANADGTRIAGIDISHIDFTHIKIAVVETADGTHSARVLVSY